MESSGLDDVSGGSNHGNTAVLDLGGAEPLESFVTSPVGKVKGVEGLDRKRVSWKSVNAGTELSAGALVTEMKKPTTRAEMARCKQTSILECKAVNRTKLQKKNESKVKSHLLHGRGKGSGRADEGEESGDLHDFYC